MAHSPTSADAAHENPIAVRPAVDDVNLERYRKLGKIPWEERIEKIVADIPSVQEPRWAHRLRDLDLLGRIIRDILKLEQAPPGRPGPRPALDVSAAEGRLRQFQGHDYSVKPFIDATRALMGDLSARQFGEKTGLGRNRLQRLLAEQDEPSAYDMRLIAESCGKHPSYFMEWRILYIHAAVQRRLEWSPESTIALFETFDNQARRSAAA